MRMFETIVTVAFFAHWTCSLISLQWCCWQFVAWAGTLGNAVQALLTAEERVSHDFLMLPLSFSSFKTKRKSCNNSSKDFVLRCNASRAGFRTY